MNKNELYLGIDTSCYTTSLAAITAEGVIHTKKMLDVKSGECGLRQSDALFQHVKNMPLLFEEMEKSLDFGEFDDVTVTVSSRPRSVDGSYMPVFMAGQSFAKVVAKSLNAKYREVSHQDGHIMAAIYSCRKYSILEEPFLVYHLSGGTSELLLCKWCGDMFDCRIVGGTKDLPAGQFIDRIGVRCGMDFPCGKYIDYSAVNFGGDKPKVKFCVNEGYINFSGEETRYERMLESGADRDMVAYSVMKCISESVKKSVEYARCEYGVNNVLMVGGVSASTFLRDSFADIPSVYFADKDFSTDNAVGVCELGRWLSKQTEKQFMEK